MKTHTIRKVVIGGSYCACGWSFHNDKLKGKTDEELILEAYAEWEKHKLVFTKKRS